MVLWAFDPWNCHKIPSFPELQAGKVVWIFFLPSDLRTSSGKALYHQYPQSPLLLSVAQHNVHCARLMQTRCGSPGFGGSWQGTVSGMTATRRTTVGSSSCAAIPLPLGLIKWTSCNQKSMQGCSLPGVTKKLILIVEFCMQAKGKVSQRFNFPSIKPSQSLQLCSQRCHLRPKNFHDDRQLRQPSICLEILWFAMLLNSFQAVKAKQKQQKAFHEVIKSGLTFLSTFMVLLWPRTTRILSRIASWTRLVSSCVYPKGWQNQVRIKLRYVSFSQELVILWVEWSSKMTNWSWEQSEFLVKSWMRQGREYCLNILHLVAWGSMGSTWLLVKFVVPNGPQSPLVYWTIGTLLMQKICSYFNKGFSIARSPTTQSIRTGVRPSAWPHQPPASSSSRPFLSWFYSHDHRHQWAMVLKTLSLYSKATTLPPPNFWCCRCSWNLTGRCECTTFGLRGPQC